MSTLDTFSVFDTYTHTHTNFYVIIKLLVQAVLQKRSGFSQVSYVCLVCLMTMISFVSVVGVLLDSKCWFISNKKYGDCSVEIRFADTLIFLVHPDLRDVCKCYFHSQQFILPAHSSS